MYLAVVPAFNEEKTIGKVIRKLQKYVDCVIVVDDYSTDATGKIAKEHGAIVLRHLQNRGVGAAMITGINYAKKLKPKIVITMDADGQHNPEDIPRIVQPILNGTADCVLGSRFLKGPQDTMPLMKKIGNKLLTFIIRILAGVHLTDAQTGFRALNQKALSLLNLSSEFTYTQEMILILSHKGCRFIEIPIESIPRKYGSSKVVSSILRYCVNSFKIIFATYLRLKLRRRD